jgi:hypothetical protein
MWRSDTRWDIPITPRSRVRTPDPGRGMGREGDSGGWAGPGRGAGPGGGPGGQFGGPGAGGRAGEGASTGNRESGIFSSRNTVKMTPKK